MLISPQQMPLHNHLEDPGKIDITGNDGNLERVKEFELLD